MFHLLSKQYHLHKKATLLISTFNPRNQPTKKHIDLTAEVFNQTQIHRSRTYILCSRYSSQNLNGCNNNGMNKTVDRENK